MKNHFACFFTLCKILIISAASFFANTVFAQSNNTVHDLLTRLQAAKPDTNKVNLLSDLAWQYVDTKRDSARLFTTQMGQLSRQLDYLKGLGDATYMEGLICYYHSQADSAELLYRQALSIYQKANRADQTDIVWQGLGLVYRTRGEHRQSLVYFQKAIEVSQQYGHKARVARTLPKVANVYLVMEQYDKAIATYQQARQMYLELKDTNSSIETLASIAYTYQSMKRYDTAITAFKQALAAFEKANYVTYIPVAFTELGKTFMLMEQYDSAWQYFKKAEDWYQQNDMQSHQDAQNNYMGQTLKRFSEAKPYLDKGLKLAAAEHDIEMIGEAYWGLYNFYNAQGDFKMALVYHEKFTEARDSIRQRMQFEQLAEMTTKYETAKKDKQIAEQTLDINRKKYWLYSVIAFMVLGTLLSYSYYRRFKLKKEKQMQQEVLRQQDIAVKAILQAEENERKRIAGELHDGVGQLMSATRMNLSAFEQDLALRDDVQKQKFERIISLVDESCKEVRMVSHNMMPNALLKNGLANAVRDFLDKIDNRVIKVDLYSEGLNERLDANVETVLYRVIQECVNNVIKHSQANHLDLSLIRHEDTITITIEDNGVGFDATQKDRFEGIGLKNIITRINYLKGEIEFSSGTGKGTLVAIYVPLQENKVA
jgi:signal transduction histidine kinase